MTDIIEELKQAFTIEVSVPFVDGLSIDLIQVAIFIVIFGVFLVLGGLLRRYLRRLFMQLQMREDRQGRALWVAHFIVGLAGLIAALNAFGAPRDLMRRLLSYSIPIGQTRLSVTSIAVAAAIVVASTLFARYLRVVLRDKALPAPPTSGKRRVSLSPVYPTDCNLIRRSRCGESDRVQHEQRASRARRTFNRNRFRFAEHCVEFRVGSHHGI